MIFTVSDKRTAKKLIFNLNGAKKVPHFVTVRRRLKIKNIRIWSEGATIVDNFSMCIDIPEGGIQGLK